MDSKHKNIANRERAEGPTAFSTSLVMRYYQGKNRPTYYLPTFVRCRVLSIAKIKYEEMNAEVTAEIFITVMYPYIQLNGGSTLKELILDQGIKCSFEKGPCLELRRGNPDISIQEEGYGLVTYIVREFVSTTLECDNILWAPFEKVKCRLSLSLYRQRVLENEDTIHEVHFNMMDHPQVSKKIVASPYANFGMFGICKSDLNAIYTRSILLTEKSIAEVSQRPKRKNKKMETMERLPLLRKQYGKERPDSFNAAHFTVNLYKKPEVALITIFFPLLLMGILNLGVFYQRPDMHKRILSVSALMVAIVALVPTIRQEIPPIPKITIVEAMVFFESLTTILALIDSLRLGDLGDEDPYIINGLENPLFVASLVVTLLVNILTLAMYLTYKFKWEPQYKSRVSSADSDFEDEHLNHFEWRNADCDEEFVKFYDEKMIELIHNPLAGVELLKEYGESISEVRESFQGNPSKKIGGLGQSLIRGMML